MKTVAIVQARMGSTRLPNKVMMPVNGIPLIGALITRLRMSSEINKIVVATSTHLNNKPLIDYVESLGVDCFVGDEDDVLSRYYLASKNYRADIIVRITGDCPLVDPVLVDKVIKRFKETGVDYCSNVIPPTFPDGLDAEVFSYKALSRAYSEATEAFDREHVTPYLRKANIFKNSSFNNEVDHSNCRWTVDEFADYEVVNKIFSYFSPRIDFSWSEILELEFSKPNIFLDNKNIKRNEGSTMGLGQKLWKRAKQIIPGGNMLLSKRAEMFLPELWPAYYSKAKGCKVWDLDGREYIDMSIMGIGTNTLGYGNDEVDDAVRRVISDGNMSTLNCPEEVYLAERLIQINPWADMVRLARTGGEANAIAIRIARAASGKDKVAICGYHGWHDWYLSANLGHDRNLDGHLMPGLDPRGVPRNLLGTVIPFSYNDYEELERIIANNNDIGVIKMEVMRSIEPTNNYLKKVRELATRKGIVLIFDECSSGFRQSFGGLHKVFDVEPDIAMYGKTLGNGYAITAVVGRRDIMDAAQSTFISSTFWTERIGPVAALKALEVMEKTRSWETITKIGNGLKHSWENLAKKYELKIETNGIPAFAGFSIVGDKSLEYKTLITQEMLRQGFLAGTSVYACIEHSQKIIDRYFEALDPIFSLIKECEEGRDVKKLLQGPVCHSGFKRLN